MDIKNPNELVTFRGPADRFAGNVWLDELATNPKVDLHAYRVSFAPGGKTAWHTHERGQLLLVVSGVGYVQKRGEPVREIRPGDVVTIAPGEEHWHGATDESFMCHIAVQHAASDEAISWLAHVADEATEKE